MLHFYVDLCPILIKFDTFFLYLFLIYNKHLLFFNLKVKLQKH